MAELDFDVDKVLNDLLFDGNELAFAQNHVTHQPANQANQISIGCETPCQMNGSVLPVNHLAPVMSDDSLTVNQNGQEGQFQNVPQSQVNQTSSGCQVDAGSTWNPHPQPVTVPEDLMMPSFLPEDLDYIQVEGSSRAHDDLLTELLANNLGDGQGFTDAVAMDTAISDLAGLNGLGFDPGMSGVTDSQLTPVTGMVPGHQQLPVDSLSEASSLSPQYANHIEFTITPMLSAESAFPGNSSMGSNPFSPSSNSSSSMSTTAESTGSPAQMGKIHNFTVS